MHSLSACLFSHSTFDTSPKTLLHISSATSLVSTGILSCGRTQEYEPWQSRPGLDRRMRACETASRIAATFPPLHCAIFSVARQSPWAPKDDAAMSSRIYVPSPSTKKYAARCRPDRQCLRHQKVCQQPSDPFYLRLCKLRSAQVLNATASVPTQATVTSDFKLRKG